MRPAHRRAPSRWLEFARSLSRYPRVDFRIDISEQSAIASTKSKRSGAARRRLKKERQQAIDEQFARLSLNPDEPPRLPPELLFRILKAGAPLITDPEELRGPEGRKRNDFLCRASLVPGLREEAQKLLWECVVIRSDGGSRSFILSELKELKTRTLAICGAEVAHEDDGSDWPFTGSLGAGLVEDVVSSSHGVRFLSLAGVGRNDAFELDLDPRVFLCGSLTELERLDISRSVVFAWVGEEETELWRLPFTLSESHLENYWSRSRLPESLVAGLLNSGARHVRLVVQTVDGWIGEGGICEDAQLPSYEYWGWDTESTIALDLEGPFLPNPAHTLDLRFDDPAVFRDPIRGGEGLAYFLHQCHHLKTLRTDNPCPELFEHLPQPIRTLLLVDPDDDHCSNVIQALEDGTSSLAELETLEIAVAEGAYDRSQAEMAWGRDRSVLKEAVAARGIMVIETPIKDIDSFVGHS